MSRPAVYFCELCGEYVFATEHPSRCPACGALPELLVEALGETEVLGRDQEWSEAIVEGGERAIRQEVETANLYAHIAGTAQHPALRAAFKALQTVEARHARLLCAVFKLKRPRASMELALDDLTDLQRLDLVREREDSTIDLYGSQLPLTEGTPIHRVYRALMDIEADHNALAERLRTIVLAGGAPPH